jgi:carbon-monoxide dehydrogenase large subunit
MNFMPPFDEARPSVGGLTIDSGNYPATLDQALELSEYESWRTEQQARRDRAETKVIGIGLSTYLENCGWGPSKIIGNVLKYAGGGWEAATIRCHPTGKVVVVTGTTPHGQGNQTTIAQLVADELGIPFDDIEVLYGDTDVSPSGWDTYGSRGNAVGMPAVHRAAQKVIEKGRKVAAHELEVAESDIEFKDGKFSVRGAPDVTRTIASLAFSTWTGHNLPDGLEPGLEASAFFDPGNLVFPFGAHVCVVEVDTETGDVEVVKYVAVDDVGPIINPQIVEGQVMGGVVQGIAEALSEEAIYDENGTLTTSSMTQYLLPAATEVPNLIVGSHETPSTTNELGVKGVGETGTIAAPPAVVNAVVDAVAHLGVTDIERPASPERIWRAIQAAKGGAS